MTAAASVANIPVINITAECLPEAWEKAVLRETLSQTISSGRLTAYKSMDGVVSVLKYNWLYLKNLILQKSSFYLERSFENDF